MRTLAAYDVACLMKYKNLTLDAACAQVVNTTLREMGGEGGLIAVDRAGNIALPFNSEGMYRAWVTTRSAPQVAIYRA
jgi:beta-aspartyl-peptidase (threonine type)